MGHPVANGIYVVLAACHRSKVCIQVLPGASRGKGVCRRDVGIVLPAQWVIEEFTSTGLCWVLLVADQTALVLSSAFTCGYSEVGGGECGALLSLEVLGAW